MKCGKRGCPGKAKCSKCKGKKIPTPKPKRQKGNAKAQPMRKRSAY